MFECEGVEYEFCCEGDGHGLNLDYVADEAYQQIFEFLRAN